MTRKPLELVVAGLMLVAAVFVNGCASEVDDPSQSDSVLSVESISPSQVVSLNADPTDELVTALVTATSRGDAKGSPLNDVIIDNYSVFYDPPLNGTVGALNFATTLVVKSGGSSSLTVVAIPVGMKPLVSAVVNATLEVEGRDTLGNPATASGRFTILIH